jgi:hypothetical protein
VEHTLEKEAHSLPVKAKAKVVRPPRKVTAVGHFIRPPSSLGIPNHFARIIQQHVQPALTAQC